MSAPSKITSSHLARLALIYIRQSSIAQVRENTESTARQYALAEHAARYGWDGSQIVVIDADLGLSGRSASARSGFQELVSRVCLGEVGAIFGLEVSRLARSSADFQRLLEFCALTDTLIVDADGIYDLHSFNDRLLLGLKGTMSEAELHVLAGRLQESKRSAARRGELRFPLPVGYVYDEDGATVMDPDEEIRQAIADVFAGFEASGSAYGAVGAFAGSSLPLPGIWRGLGGGDPLGTPHLRPGPRHLVQPFLCRGLCLRALSLAAQPQARRHRGDPYHRVAPGALGGRDPGPSRRLHLLGDLPGQRGEAGGEPHSQRRPPASGGLQGIVICGACGRPMSTNRPAANPSYECCHSRADHTANPGCRSVMAELVDAAVAARLLEVVSPDEIALALAAADELSDRRARRTRAAELAVERAAYEAARAERAFHHCDPDNRLVARSLESRWEDKLGVLASAEAALATAGAELTPLPSRQTLEGLARELPRLWAADSTSPKDRKRIIRSLILEVTLTSQLESRTVRWRTGATEELAVTRKLRIAERRCISPEVVETVRRLGPRMDNKALAEHLASQGFLTGAGRPFDGDAVGSIRHYYGIGSPELLAAGELTVRDVADRLGITQGAVIHWIDTGRLRARRGHAHRWCIPFPEEVEATCREWVASSPHIHRDIDPAPPDPEELTIATVAQRLEVSTHVVYYWAEHGYIPVRRGRRGRCYVRFTADVEAACRRRISDSSHLPAHSKTKAVEILKGVAV
ncbi:MAG: recombinase family protein [Actinomycetota bacterium]